MVSEEQRKTSSRPAIEMPDVLLDERLNPYAPGPGVAASGLRARSRSAEKKTQEFLSIFNREFL